MLRDLSIAWRITLFVVLGAGLVLLAVSAYTYVQARDLLESQKRAEIKETLQATANRIEVVESNVEKIVQSLALSVDDLNPDRRQAKRLLQRAVLRNTELFGAAIGYRPSIYGGFAPYAYMSGKMVVVKNLGKDGRPYWVGDWYQIPVQTGRPTWTEPYYDMGGSNTLTATYALPVHLAHDGPAVSVVVTGDVSLTWLTRLLDSLDLGDTGYAFLISRNGTFITHPRPDFIMNESIFSVAEARNDPALRAVGRRMISGHSGYVEFDGLRGLQPDERSYLVYTSIPSTGWSLGIVYAVSEVNSAVIDLSRVQWAIGLVGLVALLLLALFVARSITRPLHALDAATRTLAHGDLDAVLPQARGRDEIAHLTTSFGDMRDDLQRYIEELRVTTAERERMESELRVAAEIQMSLVPRTFPPYPQRHDLDLYATLEPAREVGGDFYDFFLLDQDRLCLAVADVSGKGMPAALLMAVGRSFLRSFARESDDPARILAWLNEELSADNDNNMFVTMFLAVVDLRSGAVTFASAGHNRPFVIRHDGRVEQLPHIKGIALGARAGMEFADASLQLDPGDALFLYTDGVSEAMDADGKVFSEERLAAELAGRADRSCAELLAELMDVLREHAAGVEQSDDITMVAFRHFDAKGEAGASDA